MKIGFTPLWPLPADQVAANEQETERRGLPPLRARDVAPRLAVIGGGPSIADHVSAFRNWDGEIWAVNGAWRWCRQRGIEAVFFSTDALPGTARLATGAERAILAARCAPETFDALARGADVEVIPGDERYTGGPTTACIAPVAALERGHRHVTFFGCESSYSQGTHAYPAHKAQARMRVLCGGAEYETSPDMLMQADYLSAMICAAPSFLTEQSGGLLRAMVTHGDVDVIAGPPAWRLPARYQRAA